MIVCKNEILFFSITPNLIDLMFQLLLIYVTMTQKRGPDEEKSDFQFWAFLVLYYINKACVNILLFSIMFLMCTQD